MSNLSPEDKSIVERIERLEEEKKGISDAIKDIYTEAKSKGCRVKGIRIAVKRRKMTHQQREEARQDEEYADLVEAALGEFGNTKLGSAAIERAPRRGPELRAIS